MPPQRNGHDAATQTTGPTPVRAIVHLEPPTPVELPPKETSISLIVRLFDIALLSVQQVQWRPVCARTPSTNMYETKFDVGYGVLARGGYSARHESTVQTLPQGCRYLVLGVLGANESVPHEVLLPVRPGELFAVIRRGMRQLRPLYQRVFSLKTVAGFTLYECVAGQGYHHVPELSDDTRRTMAELWKDFQTLDHDYGDRWLNWVHEHLNNDSDKPADGGLALQLVLRWSPHKLLYWGAMPILLSIGLGVGYMCKPRGDEDFLAVVQTAWGIASYIVTAASLGLAVAAAITQVSDK